MDILGRSVMSNHTQSFVAASRVVQPASVILVGALLLSACGGGSSPSTPTAPPPVVNQSLGGIWKSQYTVTAGTNNGDTINALAIATEQGDFVTIGKNAN